MACGRLGVEELENFDTGTCFGVVDDVKDVSERVIFNA